MQNYDNKLILKNCRLIKDLTEGYEDEFADILIEGNLIAEIKGIGHSFHKECRIIDMEGRTVMPGFFELHSHLYMSHFNFNEIKGLDQGTTIFNAYQFAKEYLKAGYTTVRDVGSTYNATVAINNAISKGIVEGPRIISSGLILTPTETGNSTFDQLYYTADGADEMRKGCRIQFEKGNDFIKLMVTGAFLNENSDPGLRIATLDEIKAAVEIAAMKNSYVAGHCHGAEGIKMAIRAGVRTIEHASFIDKEAIELLKNNENCFVIPTGAVGMHCLDENNKDVLPDALEKTMQYAEKEKQCINNAYEEGLLMGFGSDLDMKAFKETPGYEFIARKDYYSFKDIDILTQATINSAKILGLDHLLGTIKEGKYADLVAINGKPDEDVHVLQNAPDYVFKEGKQIYL